MPVRMPKQLMPLPEIVPSDINEKRSFLLNYLAQSVFCYEEADRSQNFNQFLSTRLFYDDRSGTTYKQMIEAYQRLLREYETLSVNLNHHVPFSNERASVRVNPLHVPFINERTEAFRKALNTFSRTYLRTELSELLQDRQTALLTQMLVWACDPLYTRIFVRYPPNCRTIDQDRSLKEMRDTLIGSQLSEHLHIEDLAQQIAFASPDTLLKHIKQQLIDNYHLSIEIPDVENAIRLHRLGTQRFAEGTQRKIGEMLLAWIAFKEKNANQGDNQSSCNFPEGFLISDTLIDYPNRYGHLGNILKIIEEDYEKQYSFFHRLANRLELDKLLWTELASQLAKAGLPLDFLQSDTFTQLLEKQNKSERDLIRRAISYHTNMPTAAQAKAIYEGKVATVNQETQRFLNNQREARAEAETASSSYASSRSEEASSSNPYPGSASAKRNKQQARAHEEVEKLRAQARAFFAFLNDEPIPGRRAPQGNPDAFRHNWEKAQEEKFAKFGGGNNQHQHESQRRREQEREQDARRQHVSPVFTPATPPKSCFSIQLGERTTVRLEIDAALLASIESWKIPSSFTEKKVSENFRKICQLLMPLLPREAQANTIDESWCRQAKATLRRLLVQNHPDKIPASASTEKKQHAENATRLLNNITSILNDYIQHCSSQDEAAPSSKPSGPR